VIDILSKFKSPAFIATVLDKGDILQAAVDLNFMHVVGATTSKEDADYCSARFKGIDSVKIFYGEEIILHEVIKDINVAITFCLDTRSEPTPALLQELGILKHHRIKTHYILIQNIHLLNTPESGNITLQQVQECLHKINNLYLFTEENDLLVARYP
jgi:hypothetical protein